METESEVGVAAAAADSIEQVVDFDDLDVEVAEAAAAVVERQEGAELRNLRADEERLEATVGLGVGEARDLQFVEALAVVDERAFRAAHLPLDAEHLADGDPRRFDGAGRARLEADELLDLVFVFDLSPRRSDSGFRRVAFPSRRDWPLVEERLLVGDDAVEFAHQILGH